MFKLELSDNKIFKDIFDTVSGIVDEVVLECDSEGMRLRCLDRSHITFVNLELKASFFDEMVRQGLRLPVESSRNVRWEKWHLYIFQI